MERPVDGHGALEGGVQTSMSTSPPLGPWTWGVTYSACRQLRLSCGVWGEGFLAATELYKRLRVRVCSKVAFFSAASAWTRLAPTEWYRRSRVKGMQQGECCKCLGPIIFGRAH